MPSLDFIHLSLRAELGKAKGFLRSEPTFVSVMAILRQLRLLHKFEIKQHFSARAFHDSAFSAFLTVIQKLSLPFR